jgi:hypothetical protein
MDKIIVAAKKVAEATLWFYFLLGFFWALSIAFMV